MLIVIAIVLLATFVAFGTSDEGSKYPKRVAPRASSAKVAPGAPHSRLVTHSVATSREATTRRSPSKIYGIAFGDTLWFSSHLDLVSALESAQSLGVRWIRVDLSWADVQPSKEGDFNWAPFDEIVKVAKLEGLSILPTIAYTPSWARPDGCLTQMCAPADVSSFARFAGEAAARYAPQGLHTWEIWNEENTPGFWSPSPNPDEYAQMVIRTSATIRQNDHSAQIVVGGLAATLTGNGAIDTRTYLTDICKRGINRIVDAIGYHPYTYPYLASQVEPWGTSWNKIADTSVSFRSILTEYGTPNLPIWITEYGAPTAGIGSVSAGPHATKGADHVSDTLQAEIAVDAVATVASSPEINAMFWYSDRDLSEVAGSEGSYGLRNADGTPKPAFLALKRQLAVEQRAGGS